MGTQQLLGTLTQRTTALPNLTIAIALSQNEWLNPTCLSFQMLPRSKVNTAQDMAFPSCKSMSEAEAPDTMGRFHETNACTTHH